MTWTFQNDPSRHSQDDSAGSTLKQSILVVEDDPSVSQLLFAALGTWGYDVFLAKNGREGLYVLTKQVVDGILLDINMPVMSGQTMLDELRWLGNQTPVVVMSGGLDVPTLRQLAKEGAQGFAVKPFSLPSLRKICSRVFDRPADDAHSAVHWSVASL
jgi:DNA-binding NtrC family response regulator